MGSSLDTSHPLAAVPDVYAALWGDFDNDGLTDVYLCRRGSNQLWRQTEKGRWSNVSGPARAEGAGGTTIDGAMFDADHDGDLDLLLIKSDGASELLNNNGDGTFRPLGGRIGLGDDRRPSSGILLADLDSRSRHRHRRDQEERRRTMCSSTIAPGSITATRRSRRSSRRR